MRPERHKIDLGPRLDGDPADGEWGTAGEGVGGVSELAGGQV